MEPKTELIFKLKCDLVGTNAILLGLEIEKARLPNALVKINEKGEFFTSNLNRCMTLNKSLISTTIILKIS